MNERRFRFWLEAQALTEEERAWVKGLEDCEVRAIASYLSRNGVRFVDGFPENRHRAMELLDEAFVEVEAERNAWGRW
jgi:acylphosphatase